MLKREEDDFIPLGLLSLAATLRTNHEVTVYPPRYKLIHREDYVDAAQHVLENQPDLIGFSTWCISYPASILIAEEIKKLSPSIPILFGGPQASILAEETLSEFSQVDYVLTGEADLTFPAFAKEIFNGKTNFEAIPGLVFRNNHGLIHKNSPARVVGDLDQLPVPAYDLLPHQKKMKLDVGRGCPYRCTYCSTNEFFSKKYRVKTVDRIITEMLSAHDEMNISHFGFAHDMFTLNREMVLDLCSKLIEIRKNKGLKLTWTCSSRIDTVTDTMLIQMEEAGCRSIFFGIESGSEKMQKNIRKHLDVPRAYQIADLFQKTSMEMHASFILGFPDETEVDLEQTLKSILKLALKGVFVQSSELSLLPGTPLFEQHKDELESDGYYSSFSRAFCGPEEKQLIAQYPKIFSSFYFLPVKTLTRVEMVFINQLINTVSFFKNTLFLLSPFIESDLKKYDLLNLFKQMQKDHKDESNRKKTIVSHWLGYFRMYIQKYQDRIDQPWFNDIFTAEAFAALLQTLFMGWQMIHDKENIPVSDEDFVIKPTPVWKVFTTSYRLESALPSENGWNAEKRKYRSGNYDYLLVAQSDTVCKRVRVTPTDKLLLANLSELSFKNYVKKVKMTTEIKKCLRWIKRMERLGVLETTCKTE